MSNGSGSFEKAFEELIRRVIHEEIASGAMASASAAAPAAAPPAETAPTPAAPPRSGGAGYRALNEALSSILQPASQTDIMAATVRGALAVCGRSALLVRRGDQFAVWRAEGYAGQTGAALRSVAVSAAEPGMFKDICDTLRPVCRQRTGGVLPPPLEQALGSAVGPHLCLMPVIVQGKVVAALYSDAGGVAGSEEMSALEMITRVCGLSLETAASRSAEAPRPATAAVSTATEARAAEPPVAPASDGAGSRGSFASGFPVASGGAPDLPPPPDADTLPEPERDSHKKAHRFARVAVQDLLSYHRDKIEQGRKNRNLFTVLREDIEKTRENYQRRFGQTPARAFDYLHYEMVSKLAGNDPGVLGEQYPGPWAGE
jgi:hypothetical protein